MLNWDLIEIWSRFVSELVISTQPSGPLCLWQCLDIIWYRWGLTMVLREEKWENNIPKGTKGMGIQCLDLFDWFNLILNLYYPVREFCTKLIQYIKLQKNWSRMTICKKSPEDAHSSSFLYFSDFRCLQYCIWICTCIWIITSGAERASGASRRWGNP